MGPFRKTSGRKYSQSRFSHREGGREEGERINGSLVIHTDIGISELDHKLFEETFNQRRVKNRRSGDSQNFLELRINPTGPERPRTPWCPLGLV